jgi:hypothetical protein
MLLAGVATIALTAAARADSLTWSPDEGSGQAPAVSAVNGKIGGSLGDLNGRDGGNVDGSLALPVGHAFGLQVDGMAGQFDSDFVYGAAAQGFWRDPSRALLGVFGSYLHDSRLGGHSGSSVGPEAELYLGRLTLGGRLGAQFGDVSRKVATSEDLSWYPTDDIDLSIGHQLASVGNVAAAGAEMQVYSGPSMAVSLFTEGRLATEGRHAVWGGVRIYFGEGKSLIHRHREDDPPNLVLHDLYGFSEGLTGSSVGTQPPPGVSFEEE